MFWVHEYRKLLLSFRIQRAQQMRLWETKSRFRGTWSLDKMGFLWPPVSKTLSQCFECKAINNNTYAILNYESANCWFRNFDCFTSNDIHMAVAWPRYGQNQGCVCLVVSIVQRELKVKHGHSSKRSVSVSFQFTPLPSHRPWQEHVSRMCPKLPAAKPGCYSLST